VVWIGKKRYSSDTMCVKWRLEWGSTRFTFLGLHFSVNIDEIEKLNYTPKLKEIENTLQIWSKQILTPIGEITIIKSLIISSKLNRLFLTIPSPKENIINQLVSKIYSFNWDNKPDKIKKRGFISKL
jgi:hypothetical protein